MNIEDLKFKDAEPSPDEVEALRLRLLANGYQPLANRDKRCFLPAWPSVNVTSEAIAEWRRKHSGRYTATGVRLGNGLACCDVDIDDQKIVDALFNWTLDTFPETEQACVRRGSGNKEAIFLRTTEPFGRIHTRAFQKPGALGDDPAHRVEIFGSSSRQMGAFGAHTREENGVVTKEYFWLGGRSLLTVPLQSLPELPKGVFFAICDTAERLMLDAGWKQVKLSTSGEDRASYAYDLTDGMTFHCNNGLTLTLAQLETLAASGELRAMRLRCSASWLEGPSAKRTDRCLMSSTNDGRLVITETSSGVAHLRKPFEPDWNALAERAQQIKTRFL